MSIKKHIVLVGSEAIKFWCPNFDREPNDRDFAISEKDVPRHGNTEYLYNPVFVDYVNAHLSTEKQKRVAKYIIPTKDELLTLKASHLIYDIKWGKHLYDTGVLVRNGAKIIESLFYDLVDFWESIHGKRRTSDLTLDAENFFDNAVNGKTGFDHDHLHTLLKDIPTYTKILKDGSEVEPDVNKFKELSLKDKLSVVEEEVMVMAYERFNKIGYRHAYSVMLKKFILNHAPIWEVPFIIENYGKLEKPSFNYYKAIENEKSS